MSDQIFEALDEADYFRPSPETETAWIADRFLLRDRKMGVG